MKIKTRLNLNTIISLGTIILLLLSLVWSFREIIITDRDMELVDEIRKVAFERILLRDEFLLYQEERAKIQWYAKSKTLRDLFALADTHFDQDDKALMQDALKYFNAAFSGMSRVMDRNDRQDSGMNTKLGFNDLELRQISQVLLTAYSMMDNLNRLHESTQKKAARARNRGAFISVIFTIIGIIAIIINSAVIRKTLAKRIAALGRGVELIGGGDREYRITAEGDDELTDLALACNEMAAKLKQSDASVANAEEALTRRAEELSRSNEELKQFAYIASHDLQEPLRMIASYLQLIERRYKGKLDKDADEFITFAVEGANRLQEMIIGLLAYSRVQTKGKPFEEINSAEVLGYAVANLKLVIEESGTLVTAGTLPVIRADAGQLLQVFQNLIANAIKFRGKDAPLIQISAEQKSSEWVFSVKDNGTGIEPEYKEKVFDMFRRLHGREYPGVGIGLSLCRRIIERHKGRIWIESEAGQGTTFYFTIPIKEDETK